MKLIGISLICLLAIVCVHAQEYDREYTEAALSWNAQVQKCKMHREVEDGETYFFPGFPAGAQHGLRRHGYGHPGPAGELLGPRECKWKFSTKDDCQLALYVKYYEQGYKRCWEQYLEISDESSTIRVCGRGSPPPYFESSGYELKIEHYHRSGYYPRGSSYLVGYVTCKGKGESYESVETYYDSAESGNENYYGAGGSYDVTYYESGEPSNATYYESGESGNGTYYGSGDSGNDTYYGAGGTNMGNYNDTGAYQTYQTYTASPPTKIPRATTETLPKSTVQSTAVPQTTTSGPAETTTAVAQTTTSGPAKTTTAVAQTTTSGPAETTTALAQTTTSGPAETTTAVAQTTTSAPAETTTAVAQTTVPSGTQPVQTTEKFPPGPFTTLPSNAAL